MHNLTGLLMQMEQIESEIRTRLTELKGRLIKGCSNDGLVEVWTDIWFNVKDITISREKLAAKPFDLKTLETHIVQGVNDALTNTRDLLKTEVGKVFGGNVPPEFFDFLGGQEPNSEERSAK